MTNNEPKKNFRRPISHAKLTKAKQEATIYKSKAEQLQKELELEEQYCIEMPPEHLDFCYHYMMGESGVCGNAKKAYKAAFGTNANGSQLKRFMCRKHIALKLKELQGELEALNVGKRVLLEDKLMSIMEECSTKNYKDKFGNDISPAAMRSVAISAIKELNSMNGFNKPIETKITTDEESGIVFNVIVPESKQQ